MAEPRLSAHAEFFKQLSLDCQQLKLLLRILEELIFRALVRGRELGDSRLLILHEQLEVLALRARRITDDLEERLSHELEAMGAVSKKAFWQVADHFLGIKREQDIRVAPDFSTSIREEVRADTILKTKNTTVSGELEEKPYSFPEIGLSKTNISETAYSNETQTKFAESSFSNLIHQCEQRLHDLLEKEALPLTLERKERVALQAERTTTYIMHERGLNGDMPREPEMIHFSLRAEYELNRILEIQRDLMDEGEENLFRAYKIADRLASIEGRLTYEAMKNGTEPPLYLSYVAKKEFHHHQEEFSNLAQDLTKKYALSEIAAQHCAQNMLQYKEMHGVPPSRDQTAKMAQISQQLEHKEYTHISHDRDAETSGFLRGQEADLLFRNGSSYDASRTRISKATLNGLPILSSEIEGKLIY